MRSNNAKGLAQEHNATTLTSPKHELFESTISAIGPLLPLTPINKNLSKIVRRCSSIEQFFLVPTSSLAPLFKNLVPANSFDLRAISVTYMGRPYTQISELLCITS